MNRPASGRIHSMVVAVSLAGLAAIFLQWGCSSRVSYRTDYPLTGQNFFSRDHNFSGRVPQGWMIATDRENDSVAPSLVALMIKDDYSATLSFRELLLDRLTSSQVDKEGLPILARITPSLQNQTGNSANVEMYNFHGQQFCGYELSPDKRIVFFRVKGHCYECVVKPEGNAGVGAHAESLFNVQQTVMTSLSF